MAEIHRIGKNVPGTENVIATLEEAKGEVLRMGIKKCMVLFLDDDTEGSYAHKFLASGLRNSEMVCLLDLTKDLVKEKM